jgi:hypothetical protein
MKKLILILVVVLSLPCHPFAQQRKGRSGRPRHNLIVAMAQQVLNQQIDWFPDDCLFTCAACWDPNDKEENDNFQLLDSGSASSPAPIEQFLINEGYIRVSGDHEYFTAKAKRSPYFNPHGGFRFARLKNPKIMVSKVTDPTNVPIEYDFVPTELTMKFFGGIKRVKAVASFVYQDGKWYLKGFK